MESNLTTPAIVIFTSADCADVWNDVLLGIEEEGIPFVIQENDSTDVIHNAWLAACQSQRRHTQFNFGLLAGEIFQ